MLFWGWGWGGKASLIMKGSGKWGGAALAAMTRKTQCWQSLSPIPPPPPTRKNQNLTRSLVVS